MQNLDGMIVQVLDTVSALWAANRPPRHHAPLSAAEKLRVALQETTETALERLIEARRLLWLDTITQEHLETLEVIQKAERKRRLAENG